MTVRLFGFVISEGAGGDDRGDDHDGDEAQSREEIAHGCAPSHRARCVLKE